MKDPAWWQRGALYEIYTRSFGDADGDGVGDLAGIRKRLDYLQWLGIAGIWLTPFYRSPMADFGYDVEDHTDVDPRFGTLADFDALIEEAHRRDIRVVIDYVPNHTSDRHPWFEASRSSRDDPKRAWYFWRDPRPDGGPPNNWLSLFGGPAWEWDPATGQYYLHTFLREQPDLDWRNPEVEAAMFGVARFWLDRGVDGFRIDVAGAVMKDPELRDNPINENPTNFNLGPEWARQLHIHDFEHPDVYDVWRRFRRVVDEYDRRDGRERVIVAEVAAHDLDRWAGYYGPELDGVHLPFGFHLIRHDWDRNAVRPIVDAVEAAVPPGAWPNWVLGNHDQHRVATIAGPDRARVAMMLLLTLRGAPTLYYGDELGMTDVEIPEERIADPFGQNVPGQGRDMARTPMPWTSEPNGGFTRPEVEPWLPLGPREHGIDVESQRADPRSILNLTRELLHLRHAVPALSAGSYEPLDGTPEGVFAYRRRTDHDALVVALNPTAVAVRVDMPDGGRIILSTGLDRTDEQLGEGGVELTPFEGVIVRPARRPGVDGTARTRGRVPAAARPPTAIS
jgi:alpha-glucosidase